MKRINTIILCSLYELFNSSINTSGTQKVTTNNFFITFEEIIINYINNGNSQY